MMIYSSLGRDINKREPFSRKLRWCTQVLTRIIEELNEYLPSMKFDSYYDDNLLQPEVGEMPHDNSISPFKGHCQAVDSDCSKVAV